MEICASSDKDDGFTEEEVPAVRGRQAPSLQPPISVSGDTAQLESIEQTQRVIMEKLELVMVKLDSYGSELENVKISLKDIKARI